VRKAFILLHISIFLWGFTGVFAKAIDLSEGPLVWYRILLTTICWFIILAFTKRLYWPGWKNVGQISIIGLLVSVHWLFFYGSIKYSNISIGMSCLPMIAVFSSILEPIITRQSFRWYEMMLGLIALVGMFVIFQFAEVYRVGIVLGLISAFLGSIFTIMNKNLVKFYNSEIITIYEMGTGLIWLTLLMPLYLWIFPTPKIFPNSHDWGLLLIFTIVCTVIPFNLSMKALKDVSAFAANLSLNLEPVYGILLAFAIYHEQKQLNYAFYIGAGLILLSVVIYMIIHFRHHIKNWIPWEIFSWN